MNNKILVGVMIACFAIIGTTMVTAVNTASNEKGILESPLFKIRKDNRIRNEKTQINNIITEFIQNRVLFRFKLFEQVEAGFFGYLKDDEPTHWSTCQCINTE